MSVKLTVIYDHPTDPAAFEEHYGTQHVALVKKIPNVRRMEFAKVFPKEDGTPAPAYRTADLHFDDYETACAALATPEAEATVKDALGIATGGVKFLLSDIEPA